ncbi:hypothetical protein [Streptomyces violascens]|uniref:hypothetical protein n=1 Tax=Streptomyces violascens TaxID=67381 RepID=UPI0016780BB9|nr:hypothetical protein [Streptomyces violascens]GGU38743.1 hypothetical protein GCM10010289_69520 [Streptomyces violascens]
MSSDQPPLNLNGHALLPKRSDVMIFVEPDEDPFVTGLHWRCATCDESPRFVLRDGTVDVQEPCAYPMGITTEITLDVPSGKLIVTDDLRDVYNVDFDAGASYNTDLGQAQVVQAMAAIGCAFGPVGDSSPNLYRDGENSYFIASPLYDDNDVPSLPESKCLAEIFTELRAYSIADFEDWKAKGGTPGSKLLGEYTVVDVAPGTYKFTLHVGERGFDKFDFDTERVFTHIERVAPLPSS